MRHSRLALEAREEAAVDGHPNIYELMDRFVSAHVFEMSSYNLILAVDWGDSDRMVPLLSDDGIRSFEFRSLSSFNVGMPPWC